MTPEYNGGPQTFLILGSDRRESSKDAYDREDPAPQRHDPAGALRPRTGPDLGAVDPPRPDGQHQHAERASSTPTKRSTPPTRSAASSAAPTARAVLAAETIKREVFPRAAAQRHRRRELRRLHQSRRHARLRVRQRRSPLLQRERRHDRNRLHEHQPAARLPEALLRKRARLRALPPHRLGLRARRAPAGLPARPARADRSVGRARADRQRRQSGRARDQLHLPRVGERADRADQADRLLAGQAAAPGQVPDHQRRRPVQRRRLRDLDPRTRERRRSTTSSTADEQLQLPAAPPPAGHSSSHSRHSPSRRAGFSPAPWTCTRARPPARAKW